MAEPTINQIKQFELSHGREVFNNFLKQENIPIEKSNLFDKLTALYFKINEVINISSLRNFDDIYIKHYLDSIYPYKFFSGECCDVGCGGGFPCIPLAIITELPFTGVDSVGKKLNLIKLCEKELNLNNIRAEHARAEELAKSKRTFDTVCARAVANTDKILSLCAPLVKPNGTLILYKTQNETSTSAELENKYSIQLSETIDYCLPETNINRRLFIYRK